MIDVLTRDAFAHQLNSVFRVDGHGAGTVMLELVEASELRSTGHGEAFSILFRGPHESLLPQAIYRFQHAAIGAFELFIVPIRRDEQGLYYEAVFNRIDEPSKGQRR